MELSDNEGGSIDWGTLATRNGSHPLRLRGSDGVSRGKKGKTSRRKGERKNENVANGAFTTSRRLHMRLLSALETFVRNRCAACTRATLVSFPYHVRHFCGAHTPIFYLHPSRPALPPSVYLPPHLSLFVFSFIFPFVYRISTIARATACYLLFAGTFVLPF